MGIMKKLFLNLRILFGLLLLLPLVLPGCKRPEEEEEIPDPENTYNGSGDEVILVPSDKSSFTYTLDGLSGQDVYFIFSNISPTSDMNAPVVTSESQRSDGPEYSYQRIDAPTETMGPTAIRGKPEISEFNRNPAPAAPGTELSRSITAPPPLYAGVGSETVFFDDNNAEVHAVCRYKETDESIGKTVYIWLQHETGNPDLQFWTTGAPDPGEIDQDMVDQLGEKFLLDGGTNDIYGWVTDIYGPEWGPHDFPSDMIDETTSKNEVHILLFDIDSNEELPVDGVPYVVGFFYARDNFWQSVYDFSNERIMFYLDAYLYADRDATPWQITHYWPEQVVSTLAHEFQHMIHFYQKNVLRTGVGSETWINEMCSVVTEDFISEKLGIDGPRGVDLSTWPDGSAGAYPPPPFNFNGRLPMYNYYNDYSVSRWRGLVSYSVAYAYGAYLARNFGGAQFFRDIVHSYETDHRSIIDALAEKNIYFSDSLRSWGAAVLLSDRTNTPADNLRFNTGGWIEDDLAYKLGSINLFNYIYTYTDPDWEGPYIYTSLPSSDIEKVANMYYLAGEGLGGTQKWNIRLDTKVRLTVVIRD